MILFIQGVVGIMFLIVGSIMVLKSSDVLISYMIYMMGIIAGTWMTNWLKDFKKWRRKK